MVANACTTTPLSITSIRSSVTASGVQFLSGYTTITTDLAPIIPCCFGLDSEYRSTRVFASIVIQFVLGTSYFCGIYACGNPCKKIFWTSGDPLPLLPPSFVETPSFGRQLKTAVDEFTPCGATFDPACVPAKFTLLAATLVAVLVNLTFASPLEPTSFCQPHV